MKTFKEFAKTQRIDEVFSGSGFDWEVDADFKYATFSAKFKIDDSTFNLSFYSSALRIGKKARFVVLSTETAPGKHSKTYNLSGKNLIKVVNTAMDVVRYHAKSTTEGKRIKAYGFLFLNKYIPKIKVINKITKRAFKTDPKMMMSLVGVAEDERRLGGPGYVLYYTRMDGEFSGARFDLEEITTSDLYLRIAGDIEDNTSEQEEPEVIEPKSDPVTTAIKPLKIKKTKTVTDKAVKVATPTPGQPSKEVSKDIKDEEALRKQLPVKKKTELAPVTQEYLAYLNDDYAVSSFATRRPTYKGGALKGTYIHIYSMKGMTSKGVVASFAMIQTNLDGDEGKLKYYIDKRIEFEMFKRMSKAYGVPDQFNDKAIEKQRKETILYLENAPSFNNIIVGAHSINVTDEQMRQAKELFPPVSKDEYDFYLGFVLMGIYGDMSRFSMDSSNMNQLYLDAQDAGIDILKVEARAGLNGRSIKFDTTYFELLMLADYGYFGVGISDDIISSVKTKSDLPNYQLRKLESLFSNTEDFFARVKKNKIFTKTKDLNWRTLVDVYKQYDNLDGKFPIAQAVQYGSDYNKLVGMGVIAELNSEEAISAAHVYAMQAKQNIKQPHTLQDVITFGNSRLKSGTSIAVHKILGKYNIKLDRNVIDGIRALSNKEKTQLAKDVGPELSAAMQISKYSDNEEVFKIDFIDSWTTRGGSDSQAASFVWMNDFGPYNKGNLYIDQDNSYNTNEEAPESAIDNFKKIYEHTQNYLKTNYAKKYKDGKGTIKLYRGVGEPRSKVRAYVPGSIESWTQAKGTANTFASMMSRGDKGGSVLEATVPFDSVFATYESLRGYFPPEENLKGKKEWIIFGGVLKDYPASFADTDGIISFSEWMKTINEDDMADLIRTITTDDANYQDMMDSGEIAKGIQDNADDTKAEIDPETGEYKTLEEE